MLSARARGSEWLVGPHTVRQRTVLFGETELHAAAAGLEQCGTAVLLLVEAWDIDLRTSSDTVR